MSPEERPDGATAIGVPPSRLPAGGMARMLGAWLLVVAAAVAGLRAADALPRLALGVPRGVVKAGDVADLERATGRRMPVPAYYPDSIEWPPAEARWHTTGAAAIWCRQRPGGGIALIVATAATGGDGIGGDVVPATVELQHESATLGTRAAVLSRVRDADGVVWQQATWTGRGEIILVRYRGTLDELLKIAGSVHE